jgi:hypothetical protein
MTPIYDDRKDQWKMSLRYIYILIFIYMFLPHPKREFLKNSFKFSGAKLWNSLPLQAKLAQSEYIFKMNINSLDT